MALHPMDKRRFGPAANVPAKLPPILRNAMNEMADIQFPALAGEGSLACFTDASGVFPAACRQGLNDRPDW